MNPPSPPSSKSSTPAVRPRPDYATVPGRVSPFTNGNQQSSGGLFINTSTGGKHFSSPSTSAISSSTELPRSSARALPRLPDATTPATPSLAITFSPSASAGPTTDASRQPDRPVASSPLSNESESSGPASSPSHPSITLRDTTGERNTRARISDPIVGYETYATGNLSRNSSQVAAGGRPILETRGRSNSEGSSSRSYSSRLTFPTLSRWGRKTSETGERGVSDLAEGDEDDTDDETNRIGVQSHTMAKMGTNSSEGDLESGAGTPATSGPNPPYSTFVIDDFHPSHQTHRTSNGSHPPGTSRRSGKWPKSDWSQVSNSFSNSLSHYKRSVDLGSELHDARKDIGLSTHVTMTGLRRQLKDRHVTMISIGGVIGTGLFLGSSTSLRHGGPLGILLGYMLVGTIVASVMVSLGEMVAYLPLAGGHITLSARFVDASLSFAVGWFYWYTFTFLLPTELSAGAVLMGFWQPDINPAVWVAIFLCVIVLINAAGARSYGEMEFWFASIKVITIIGLIIAGIIIDGGGGPNGKPIGFRYWHNPGPFAQYNGIQGKTGRFLSFFSTVPEACFSFVGTEIVAICAAEARNPRRNLPRAIRAVFLRIFLFYILGVFIIGLLVRNDDPALTLNDGTAQSSPFVIAIQRAGISVLPDLINAAILTSAWSCASSNMYTSSRALYGMAISGSAPSFLARTNRFGLPYLGVIVSASFGLLAFAAASHSGAGKTFSYFSTMATVGALMVWGSICLTYLRFYRGMKVQKFNRDILPFKAPFQPYTAYFGAFWCFLIALFNGWSVFLRGNWQLSKFITSYLPPLLFIIMWGGHKLIFKTKLIPYEKQDFETGSAEHDNIQEPPKTKWQKFVRFIF